MTAGNDDLNPTQWAGVIALLVLLAVPVAVALAAWCKQRYARAVTQLQRGAAAAPVAAVGAAASNPPWPVSTAAPHAAALTLDWRDAAEQAAGAPPPALRSGLRLRRRVLAAQFVLGTGYWWALLASMLMALALYSIAAGSASQDDGQTNAWGHLLLWPLLFVPPLLALAFQAGTRESHVWIAYAVGLAAMFAGLVALDTGWGAGLITIGVAALLGLMFSAFMRPAVRGAGPPLALAFVGSILALFILFALLAQFDDGSDADAPMTAEDWWLFAGVSVLLLCVSGWIAWRLLIRLARRYAAKRYSELQLAHDAYWSLITAYTLGLVLMVSFEERTERLMEWVALIVVLAWGGWRLGQCLSLRWATRRAAPAGPALLLLRVFKPSQRSEGFADRFLARWRFVGPVWMIAGPDLAGAFMEPDEFFAWLRKRLHERFVADPAQVAERVGTLDAARDPDGRFRVSELFCADTTWRDVVLALIARADVVLLDLREFTPQRAGTHFELVQLLRRAPLAKVLLLVDARDPPAPLQAAIEQAWREAGREVPAGAAPPRLALLRVADGSAAELLGVAHAAAAAASA